MFEAIAAALVISAVDVARDRGWTLTEAGVVVFDLKSRKPTAQVTLPDWLWAGAPHGCNPALAVGPNGEAIISSDVVPTLWRIDPVTLAVSKHELILDADAGKDVGFSDLTYSPEHNVFFAVSCGHGSRWRIDPLLRRGQKIALCPPPRPGFRTSACARRGRGWRLPP
jgi:hypothetical protein